VREQVEGDVGRRRLGSEPLDARRRRVDALLQRAEVFRFVAIAADHDLAVEHVAARGKRELGEVARQRLAGARLHVHVLAVDEHDRAEAVVLGLVRPAVAVGQLLARSRELGLERGLERQRHVAGNVYHDPSRECALIAYACAALCRTQLL